METLAKLLHLDKVQSVEVWVWEENYYDGLKEWEPFSLQGYILGPTLFIINYIDLKPLMSLVKFFFYQRNQEKLVFVTGVRVIFFLHKSFCGRINIAPPLALLCTPSFPHSQQMALAFQPQVPTYNSYHYCLFKYITDDV